jgi:hypothetical protein
MSHRPPICRVLLAAIVVTAGCGDETPDDTSENGSDTASADSSNDTASTDSGADAGADSIGGSDSDGDAPDSTTDGDTPERCVSDRAQWEEQLWPSVVSPVCMSCHVVDGLARDSELVFVSRAQVDYLDVNRERLATVARQLEDNVSRVLLKPTGVVEHGGGLVLREGTPELAMLEEFVARLDAPVSCDDEGGETGLDGIELLSNVETLRKATLLLSGRLPTADELDAVRNGGDDALREAIDSLTTEAAFVDRVVEWWNDILLTDKYNSGDRALDLLDEDRFPGRYFYETVGDSTLRGRLMAEANAAVARQPLELIAHVVANDRPFTEILTADYVLVNDFSATSLGIPDTDFPDPDNPASYTFREEQLDGIGQAGVLSTPSYLARYPSTPTNRNRHRSRIFFERFLATDILKLGNRPFDPTATEYHNPTLNDPQCTICHAMMDPVAGAFQNWDDTGRYNPPEDGWYPEMAPPGFGNLSLPAVSQSAALQWLAAQAVADRRFAVAVVHNTYRSITGQDPLAAVDLPVDADEAALAAFEAWKAQRDTFDAIIEKFVDSDFNLRVVVTEIVMTPYFRAAGTFDDTPAWQADHVGLAHFMTPEELNRKLLAVTGYPWRARLTSTDHLVDRYRLLYGGIDSDGVTRRLTSPNGIMVNIAERMATEMACRTVPLDFTLPAESRRLFPRVESSYVPLTAEGFEIPEAHDLILENIRYLHARVLGEDLDVDDPEVLATYQLWLDTWLEGQAAITAGTISTSLVWNCRATTDWYTGETLPTANQVTADSRYTIRAWMAVLAYMLGDYRFLYE